MVEKLRGYLEEEKRAPDSFGIDTRLSMGNTPEAEWASYVEEWRKLGATHMAVNTMGMGLDSPKDHIEAITRFWSVGGI